MVEMIEYAFKSGGSVKPSALLEHMARAEVLIVIGNLMRQMTKLAQRLGDDVDIPPVW